LANNICISTDIASPTHFIPVMAVYFGEVETWY